MIARHEIFYLKKVTLQSILHPDHPRIYFVSVFTVELRDGTVSETQIQFLGQSGFRLSHNDSSMLIDPNGKDAGNVNGELVYCTHKHFDHTGGVSTFLERNLDAILVTNEQVSKKFRKYADRVVIIEKNGSHSHGDWNLEFIETRHGFFRGVHNLGVIVRVGDVSFGHCGDSVEFEGFASRRIQTLAVPIGGIFTASPKGALLELEKFETRPSRVVIMHWLMRKPESFCKKLSEMFPSIECIIPQDGGVLPPSL